MSISKQASILSLPQSCSFATTVLEYLIITFPHIEAQTWQERVATGKVHWRDGSLISAQSALRPQQQVCYYREVEKEPSIPFSEKILFQDSHILVAYKPHFLPVTPGGPFVNECLQNRLRNRTGINTLQALHRLDRVTAGLVMFSINPDTRQNYHELFHTQRIQKTYQAIATVHGDIQINQEWTVKNRIVRSNPRFLMQVVEGDANSHSVVRCVQLATVKSPLANDKTTSKALFELHAITGKTHQLRLHMQTLGWPILNDKYYPALQPLIEEDYAAPLQLLAKTLQFIDPITKQSRHFCYDGDLSLE